MENEDGYCFGGGSAIELLKLLMEWRVRLLAWMLVGCSRPTIVGRALKKRKVAQRIKFGMERGIWEGLACFVYKTIVTQDRGSPNQT